MKRLSYSKEDKNGDRKTSVLSSKKGSKYFAIINKVKGYWKIYNAKSRGLLKQGSANNWNVIRRRVRKELIMLGVNLLYKPKESGYHKENGSKLVKLPRRNYEV